MSISGMSARDSPGSRRDQGSAARELVDLDAFSRQRRGVRFVAPMADSLLVQPPSLTPPLDPDFRPAWAGNRTFRKTLGDGGVPLGFALERSGGAISVFWTQVFPERHPLAGENMCAH